MSSVFASLYFPSKRNASISLYGNISLTYSWNTYRWSAWLLCTLLQGSDDKKKRNRLNILLLLLFYCVICIKYSLMPIKLFGIVVSRWKWKTHGKRFSCALYFLLEMISTCMYIYAIIYSRLTSLSSTDDNFVSSYLLVICLTFELLNLHLGILQTKR